MKVLLLRLASFYNKSWLVYNLRIPILALLFEEFKCFCMQKLLMQPWLQGSQGKKVITSLKSCLSPEVLNRRGQKPLCVGSHFGNFIAQTILFLINYNLKQWIFTQAVISWLLSRRTHNLPADSINSSSNDSLHNQSAA